MTDMTNNNDLRMAYRPKLFTEYCNFENSKTLRILNRQMQRNALPRLLIFDGDYSTGKTSASLLLGMWSSCEQWIDRMPCGQCGGCNFVLNSQHQGTWRANYYGLDGTDIDANEIDEIFRQTNHYMPPYQPRGKRPDELIPNIVSIDEAHRTQPKIQERLLTLVERWTKTSIILLTTKLDKIDDGLIARGTTYRFQHPSLQQTAARLLCVAEAESIPLTEADALWIAEQHDGAVRESLGDLDTLKSCGITSPEEVRQLLGD